MKANTVAELVNLLSQIADFNFPNEISIKLPNGRMYSVQEGIITEKDKKGALVKSIILSGTHKQVEYFNGNTVCKKDRYINGKHCATEIYIDRKVIVQEFLDDRLISQTMSPDLEAEFEAEMDMAI